MATLPSLTPCTHPLPAPLRLHDHPQSVLYKMESPDAMAAGVPLIDLNVEFPDGTTSIRAATPSEDGRFFAYGLSSGGTDWTVIKVRDVATGAILPGA